MKEVAKESTEINIAEFTSRLIGASTHIGVATLGFFMARTSLWGGISPLGTALAAGLPLLYTPAAGLGALLGYLIVPTYIGSLKYLAALLAIIIIRFILAGVKPALNGALCSAFTAAVVVCGVGFASTGQNFLTGGAVSLAEGLLAGGGAYFIRRATSLKLTRPSVFTEEQTASLIIAVNLILTSLYPVQLDGISAGRILALLLILFSAKYGRVSAAAICSVSAAASVCIAGQGTSIAVILCFSGLAAGVFSGLGKFTTALCPVAISGLWMLISALSSNSVALLLEAIISATVFLLVPKSISALLGRIIAPPVTTPDASGLRKTITMRLDHAATALEGVSETVEDVARCLSINRKPSFVNVLHSIEKDACRGCSLMLHCWERNRKTTTDAVLGMGEALRRCQPVNVAEIPAQFRETCLRLERFENSATKHYSRFLNQISAEKRITEMRDVLSDQLKGIAGMLCEMSTEFTTAMNYDVALAGRVAAAVKELDIRADECCCVVDKFGRMTVEMKLNQMPDLPINRAKVLSRIEEICERDFEPPEINRTGRTCYITATEKAVFSADAYVTQFNQGTNQLCGDTCKFFPDGRGRFVVILSDGMGSGGRAAVDSAMTAGLTERLIKAGFGYECTLKIVNSALTFKSTDESLSTLDISCIDLHTGRTELLKAGAAPTVVRRNGRTGRAECHSLPAGILHEVGFDKATVTFSSGDILVMMSDGACSDGTDWICTEIENWKDGGAKQLSEHLATAARRRRRDGHEDDITVFAAIIEKAV